MSLVTDLTGRRYCNLTVVARAASHPYPNDTSAAWLTVCDCGTMLITTARRLRRLRNKTCGRGKCPFMQARLRGSTQEESAENRATNLRRVRMKLTPDELQEVVTAPCHYCGTAPAGGFDRKTYYQDYSPGNTLPCCGTCQRMKGKLGPRTFLEHLKKVAEHQLWTAPQ